MLYKVIRSRYCSYWNVVDDAYVIGSFKTPKIARHKARMYYMYITTGDEKYLTKEVG